MSDRRLWRWVLPTLRMLLDSIRYLLSCTVVPTLVVMIAIIMTAEGTAPARLVVAAAVLAYILWAVATISRDRRAVSILGQRPIDDPHPPRSATSSRVTLRTHGWEPATWREIALVVLVMVTAPAEFAFVLAWLTTPFWLFTPVMVKDGPIALGPLTITSSATAGAVALVAALLIPFGAHAVVALARSHAAITRTLLEPRGEELRDRVIALTQSRTRLIDAFDIERRRIERDLHDGAQQQLVALAMTLDLARIELEDNPHASVEPLIERAYTQATTTVRELRELIDGIHPTIVTEHGLSTAARHLADRSNLPVHVHDSITCVLPPTVATTAYFVIAEALTNAAKHSGATEVHIRLSTTAGQLTGEITDNGLGGAALGTGTGLRGLADRVSAVDGDLTLVSPAGGPTTLRVTLPLLNPYGDQP